MKEQFLADFRIYYARIRGFFLKEATGTSSGRVRIIKSILGELPVSEKQARKLKLENNQKISPYLEQCCLRASAGETHLINKGNSISYNDQNIRINDHLLTIF
ncbi:hypothetical protein [Anabaena sp. UHCC 0253]|uniref:hypothetical protein n=1 Tax=unclassified Anabaena TaxID=2619674 RepID=UPI00144694FF|nr:hypothetical protein [Anabaena sp. UHCC 0204]MTJ55728.1 hypothetical protein [Anabaena sp. UHCC 0253]